MLCLLKKEQIMHRHRWLISSALLLFSSLAFAEDIAPGGTLRAAYLANNPAQSVRDPVSGEIRGASADLARELARRRNVPSNSCHCQNPPAVIEAVTKGDADIGFVAYAPERVGTVEFSQTYMLVQQSFIVPDSSPIRAVIDIDAPGRRIAGGKSDSDYPLSCTQFEAGDSGRNRQYPGRCEASAFSGRDRRFGANRQRLTNLLKEMPGYRILPDNLFGVTQTIAVAKGKPQVLGTINTFIDDIRASGFLQNAIARSGVVGLEMAPVGATLQR